AQGGPDFLEDGGRDADIGEDDVAAAHAAGQEVMGRLQAEEGDGDVGADGDAALLAAGAVDAAGHVHGDDGDAGGVDRRDDLLQPPLDLAVEAGAEQRVDYHGGAGNALGAGLLDRRVPEIGE